MRDVFSLLLHMNGKHLGKLSEVKKEISAIEHFFDERSIDCRIRSDEDLLRMSAQRDAIVQKEQLDDQLYRSLDSMQDYMQTLQYEEINRLLQVDLKEMIQSLKQFVYHGQTILLPCFSMEINERYLRSPALFIYPGYQHQLRHYRPYLQWGTYGTLPYENGFGLFTPVARENGKERIVLHLSQANRFYLLESGTIIETLALPGDLSMDERQRKDLAEAFLRLDEAAIIRCLLGCEGLKKRLGKKLNALANAA